MCSERGFQYLSFTQRPQSSSFLRLPYRILNMNPQKELLWGLWVKFSGQGAWIAVAWLEIWGLGYGLCFTCWDFGISGFRNCLSKFVSDSGYSPLNP